jgi:3-oxoacyl-(acyl-carrier-protein) synthase III
LNSTPSAVITGLGHYLPEYAVSSAEVERRIVSNGWPVPDGRLERLTGVASRRYADPSLASSDLAAEAARLALADAGLQPDEIDILIFAAATHDVAEPATSNLVQMKTGCRRAHTFDVKNACNSFLNALDLATSLIQTGRGRRILVASGEMLSPVINWEVHDSQDFQLKFAGLTLGDGAGACVLEARDDPNRGLLPGRFFSAGEHWQLSTVLSGGSLLKQDTSHLYFECRSNELLALAAQHLPPLILRTLQEVGWTALDVQLVVPHQVSTVIVRTLCELFDYPLERCMVTLDRYGNLAAASIPVALSLARQAGLLTRGDKVLLIGSAAGFSAGVIPLVY